MAKIVINFYYRTEIDREENLIAKLMSLEEIRKKIGADSLGFISLKGLKEACKNSNMQFCTKCFSGNKNQVNYHKDNLE